MLDLTNIIWECRWWESDKVRLTKIDGDIVYFEDIFNPEDVHSLSIEKFCESYKAVGEF